MIAEEVPGERRLVTEEHLDLVVEQLRSTSFRWQLFFFVPLWVGVYTTLVAILVRGV